MKQFIGIFGRMFKVFMAAAVLVLALAALFAGPVYAGNYSFTSIDVPGASLTMANGINNSGQIVGSYNDPSAPSTNGRGFLLSNGTFSTFDMPGISYPQGTILNDINYLGQIVGSYGYGDGQRGFLLSNNTWTTFNPPNAIYGYGLGINNSGNIVGSAVYEGNNGNTFEGFILSNGSFNIINAPGAVSTWVSGINNAGQIVGSFYYADNIQHGFILSNGSFSIIDVPGASYTQVLGINNVGQIIGECYKDYTEHGFILSNGSIFYIDVPGDTMTTPTGINDAGQIVGNYFDSNGRHGFLASPYEPVTIDIEPWFKHNLIDLKLKWLPIPVAILSTPTFNAPKSVDLDSLTFGHSGNEKSLAFCSPIPVDVNCDKAPDLICFFNTGEAAFQCGDTQGILKGQTKDGMAIQGSDSVKIIPCK